MHNMRAADERNTTHSRRADSSHSTLQGVPLYSSDLRPLLRSTSSFTAPTISSSHHNPASSTTKLRSHSSFSTGITAANPSGHKERERRRLKKKSRPPHLFEGMFELTDMGEDNEDDARGCDERGIISPSVLPPGPDAEGSPFSLKSTGGKRAALLSKIGSVMKWGTKKRHEMMPSKAAVGK